jgi:hypothetical protein
MFGWGKEAAVADVGTTVVEVWVGYLCQASQHLMKGHCSAGLNPVTTETEQALLHFLRPAKTEKYKRNWHHTRLNTHIWNDYWSFNKQDARVWTGFNWLQLIPMTKLL